MSAPFASTSDDSSYPLVLGSTFTTEAQQYHTLQYAFKPASIDSKTSGVLRKSENGGLEVEMMSKANEPILFKGNYTPAKEIECILIFDKVNNTFQLERLSGSGKNLKAEHKKKEKRGVSLDTEAYSEYDGDADLGFGNISASNSQEAEEQSGVITKKRKSKINDLSRMAEFVGDSVTQDSSHGPDETMEEGLGDMSDENEHDNDDIVSMMDLLNQIESNTQSVSDAGFEAEEDLLSQPGAPQQIGDNINFTNGIQEHKQVPPKVRAGEEGSSGEESESDSESESGESQSSSASDGDGSSSESD